MMGGVILFFGALIGASTFLQGNRAVLLFCLFFFVVTILYSLESLTERLILTDHQLSFCAFLKPTKVMNLHEVKELCFIHEGLNIEPGIEQCFFRMTGGERVHIPLGPFWRQRDLEAFLGILKTRMSARSEGRIMR